MTARHHDLAHDPLFTGPTTPSVKVGQRGCLNRTACAALAADLTEITGVALRTSVDRRGDFGIDFGSGVRLIPRPVERFLNGDTLREDDTIVMVGAWELRGSRKFKTVISSFSDAVSEAIAASAAQRLSRRLVRSGLHPATLFPVAPDF